VEPVDALGLVGLVPELWRWQPRVIESLDDTQGSRGSPNATEREPPASGRLTSRHPPATASHLACLARIRLTGSLTVSRRPMTSRPCRARRRTAGSPASEKIRKIPCTGFTQGRVLGLGPAIRPGAFHVTFFGREGLDRKPQFPLELLRISLTFNNTKAAMHNIGHLHAGI